MRKANACMVVLALGLLVAFCKALGSDHGVAPASIDAGDESEWIWVGILMGAG